MEKKTKNNDSSLKIPFGKAARVGNWKLWRSNLIVGSGKDKGSIECVNISDLDGCWLVRIPSTTQMFGSLCSHYATFDDNLKENFIGMIATNMRNICLTPSPALHDSLFFLTEMLTFPYLLLSEKEMEKRMDKGLKAAGMDKGRRKEHIRKMLEYRRGLYDLIERKKSALLEDYERQQAERLKQEPDALDAVEQDAIAEEALGVLNKEGED